MNKKYFDIAVVMLFICNLKAMQIDSCTTNNDDTLITQITIFNHNTTNENNDFTGCTHLKEQNYLENSQLPNKIIYDSMLFVDNFFDEINFSIINIPDSNCTEKSYCAFSVLDYDDDSDTH